MTDVALRRTLKDVRDWLAAGLPRDRATLERVGLIARAERHLGSWDAAVAATGVEAAPLRSIHIPSDVRGMVDALLGLLPDTAIARITGLSFIDVEERRRWVGIPKFSPAPRARDLASSPALRTLPAEAVGRRFGVSAVRVRALREELGIPAPAPPRTGSLSHRTLAADPRALARIQDALDTLEPKLALILRERMLREPPRGLREIGSDLGLSGERVRQLERRALVKLGLVAKKRQTW